MTKLDETNEYLGSLGTNIVSMPLSERFISAVDISFSKSDTTRSPLTITPAPIALHEIGQQAAEVGDLDVAEMLRRRDDHLLALVEREQRLALLRVDDDRDQQARENRSAARSITSRWPIVSGSNEPG